MWVVYWLDQSVNYINDEEPKVGANNKHAKPLSKASRGDSPPKIIKPFMIFLVIQTYMVTMSTMVNYQSELNGPSQFIENWKCVTL